MDKQRRARLPLRGKPTEYPPHSFYDREALGEVRGIIETALVYNADPEDIVKIISDKCLIKPKQAQEAYEAFIKEQGSLV